MNNELVRIIREQAEQYAWKMYDESDAHVTMDDTRRWIFYKYAELIIRECIQLAVNEEERFHNMDQGHLALAMENFQGLLKEHFGMEK